MSCLEDVTSINLPDMFLCAISLVVFSILSTSTHQNGSWTVDSWLLRQLLLFFMVSTSPWSEEVLPIVSAPFPEFPVKIVILLSVNPSGGIDRYSVREVVVVVIWGCRIARTGRLNVKEYGCRSKQRVLAELDRLLPINTLDS